MLLFSKDALTTLTASPGFKGEVALSEQVHIKNLALTTQGMVGSYEPQKSLHSPRLDVRVAKVEASYKEFSLEENEVSDDKKAELSEVLTFSQNSLVSISDQQKSKIQGALQEMRLLENGSCTFEERHIKDGKISLEKVVLNYKQPSGTTLQTEQTLQLFSAQMIADENLSATTLEMFSEQLLENYPLIKTLKPAKKLSHTTANKIRDVILSRTYTSNVRKTIRLLDKAISLYDAAPYTQEVIKTLAISIACGDESSTIPHDVHYTRNGVTYLLTRKEPFKIVHCQNEEELQKCNLNKTARSEIGGSYSLEFNVIMFEGSQTENTFSGHFIHEATHAVMNLLFKNETKPYFADNPTQQAGYQEVTLTVFKYVANKLGLNSSILRPLNNLAEIIEVLKRESILDLMLYETMRSKSTDSVFVEELKQKYNIEGSDFEELQEKFLKKLIEKNNELKLGTDDFYILSEFAILAYEYPTDVIEEELIVKMPQLLGEGIALSKLTNYFSPLMTYWEKNVSPCVKTLFEEYALRCAGTATLEKETTYKIEEYSQEQNNQTTKRRRLK